MSGFPFPPDVNNPFSNSPSKPGPPTGPDKSTAYLLNSQKVNLLRTNRYTADITYGKSTINNILCESVEFPEDSITTTPVQIGNRPQFLIPYGKLYGSNNLNFTIRENIIYADENATKGTTEVYSFFSQWMNNIVKKSDFGKQTYDISYYNENLGSIKLTGLDINYSRLFECEVHSAYPINIKLNTYEYSDTNNYVKITVVMAFEEFTFTY